MQHEVTQSFYLFFSAYLRVTFSPGAQRIYIEVTQSFYLFFLCVPPCFFSAYLRVTLLPGAQRIYTEVTQSFYLFFFVYLRVFFSVYLRVFFSVYLSVTFFAGDGRFSGWYFVPDARGYRPASIPLRVALGRIALSTSSVRGA